MLVSVLLLFAHGVVSAPLKSPVYSPSLTDENEETALSSVVLSGSNNVIKHVSGAKGKHVNRDLADFSAIMGGISNIITGSYASILGGANNLVLSNFAVVAGGYKNSANGRFASVLGGSQNVAAGRWSIAAGMNAIARQDNSASFGFSGKPCGTQVGGEFRVCAKKIVLDAEHVVQTKGGREAPLSTGEGDGSWKSTQTYCSSFKLETENGKISFSHDLVEGKGYPCGTVATTICKTGSRFTGTQFRKCGPGGWDGELPKCGAPTIGKDSILENGKYIITYGGVGTDPEKCVVIDADNKLAVGGSDVSKCASTSTFVITRKENAYRISQTSKCLSGSGSFENDCPDASKFDWNIVLTAPDRGVMEEKVLGSCMYSAGNSNTLLKKHWGDKTKLCGLSKEDDSQLSKFKFRFMGPVGKIATKVFINEIHYDNEGIDVNEGVEIAGPAGTDLNGWSLVGYDGETGKTYGTIPLDGRILNDKSGITGKTESITGFGALWFVFEGLQDGGDKADGIALVDKKGHVVEFLSYEGKFRATDGPAKDVESVSIDAVETGTEPKGHTLQRTGKGQFAEDFTWKKDAAKGSHGSINLAAGQVFEVKEAEKCPKMETIAIIREDLDSNVVRLRKEHNQALDLIAELEAKLSTVEEEEKKRNAGILAQITTAELKKKILGGSGIFESNGLNVVSDSATISLGQDKDVKLMRSGPSSLMLDASVSVSGKIVGKSDADVDGNLRVFSSLEVAEKLKLGTKDLESELKTMKEATAAASAAANTKVRYGERVFFDCKDNTRRCKETSSMQHGSSKEIIISGDQNLGDFELKFFVPGNAFVEVMATVMHCGGGCHSDFMNHMFAFNGYSVIREMRNDGYTDKEGLWTNSGGAHETKGSWQVRRDIVSWNMHGSYSSIMTLRHNKGDYSHGGPYYIRVRSSNHHLGLIKHIDEPASTCVFDCDAAKCTGKQAKNTVCSCYISGECPEMLFTNPDKKLSECCGPSDEEDFGT